MGDFLEGYVAEETSNYRKRRFFVALEIPKYEKGEKLTVRGIFTEDLVRFSATDKPPSEYRVFVIETASPREIENETVPRPYSKTNDPNSGSKPPSPKKEG